MGLVKLNDRGVRSATAFGSLSGGSMTFIKKLTASSSDTLSFVDGASDVVFDDTYKEYLFTFNNIHPETNGADFTFQADTSGNTDYDQTMTTAMFWAQHKEDGTDAAVEYRGDLDQAQGTAFQTFIHDIGNGNDESGSGYLHLFNPSSTTFVKHFMARLQTYYPYSAGSADYTSDIYVAGYCNVTAAIDGVQFKFASGNIDAGQIKLYGIKDS